MALDFPNAPTVGQKYPATPIQGTPTYVWDGQKWTTQGAPTSGKTPLYTDGGQITTGGFGITAFANPSGNFTVDPLKGNYQTAANNGAFTVTAPSIDCAVDLIVINGAAAGAIIFTGFNSQNVGGEAISTVNGQRFLVSIRRVGGYSSYVVKALQ